jgi:hypothetical protein
VTHYSSIWQELSLLDKLFSRLNIPNAPRLKVVDDVSRLEHLYQCGAQAFTEQRYHEAVQFALRAIALNANLAVVHYLLGSALLEMGEFGKAAQAFSACLALGPSYPLIQHALLHHALAHVRGSLEQPLHLHVKPQTRANVSCISIIVCSINPVRFARVSAQYHALLADIPHEIVGIHDASSLCEGYNRGVRQARGEFVIFSHDDIEIVTPDFAAKLLTYLQQYDLIGIAGTTRLVGPAWVFAGWPHIHGQVGFMNSVTGQLIVQGYDVRGRCTPNAQAMDGVFLAARREVVERVGFDQSNFDGWHLYDVDFTFSAYLAGFRTAICHDICLIHESRGDWGVEWQRYAQMFMVKHGDKLPSGVIPDFGELCSIALGSRGEWLSMTQIMTQVAAEDQPQSTWE